MEIADKTRAKIRECMVRLIGFYSEGVEGNGEVFILLLGLGPSCYLGPECIWTQVQMDPMRTQDY